MYEAHRSWQLPGQCRAAIIMSAARNRIRHSPALLLAWAGSMWLIAMANPAIAELARLYNEGAALRPLSLSEGGLLLLVAGVLTTLGARLATGQLLRQMEAD